MSNYQYNRAAVVIETGDTDTDDTDAANAEDVGADEVDAAMYPPVKMRQKRHKYQLGEPLPDQEQQQQQQQQQQQVVIHLGQRIRQSLVATARKTLFLPEADDNDLDTPISTYLTLKVLFLDIGISLGDTLTDFLQAFTLLSSSETRTYGFVTLALCWLPGLAAALHLISMYRDRLAWKKTLLYALLLVLLYPIVPLCAYVRLLWTKPKDGDGRSKTSKEFREAEYWAMLAHAISGAVESPIQLILQLWLILNGIIPFSFTDLSGSLTLSDWQGNRIYLPFTSAFSVLFSAFGLLKAACELNVVRMHLQNVSSTWRRSLAFLRVLADHLPCLLSGAAFRVAASVLCMAYLNTFGLLPVGALWLANVITGYVMFAGHTDRFPLWLISIMALFIPACFVDNGHSGNDNKAGSKLDLVERQYRTLFLQSLSAFFFYGFGLAAALVIVNAPFEATGFQYSPNIVLNHLQFSMCSVLVLGMGLMSVALSRRPSLESAFTCKEKPSSPTVEKDKLHQPCLTEDSPLNYKNEENVPQEACSSNALYISWRLAFTFAVVVVPIVSCYVFLLSVDAPPALSRIYHAPASNHTRIVLALPLTQTGQAMLRGTSKHFFATKTEVSSEPDYIVKDILTTFITGFFSKNIALVARPDWEQKKDQLLESADRIEAIVILDSEQHRPSSPPPPLVSSAEDRVPVFLIRKMDADFLPVPSMDTDNTIPMWIQSDPSGLPMYETPWQCSESGCLQPVFQDGHLADAKQFRLTECFRGGVACPGFDNEQEAEDYCDGPLTQVCPLAGQEFGVFQTFEVPSGSGDKRTLRSSPAACVVRPDLEERLLECDLAEREGWTEYLRWQNLRQDGDVVYQSRRRYCYLWREECMMEEQEVGRCCLGDCNSDLELKECEMVGMLT